MTPDESVHRTIRAAADVGGTFIDLVAVDAESGRVWFDKQPARADTLVGEFMTGLDRMGISGTALRQLFHGTTVAINAVVQQRGARVALVTTAGFGDVLELGRGGRPEVYNWRFATPAPLVPAERRFEVTERMLATGEVLTPLDTADLDGVVTAVAAAGVEAVAVCLLHAYANPAHERAVAAALRERLPGVAVTCSHDVAAEWHEFERTSSAVLNAYVQPLFGGYLGELSSHLAADGFDDHIGIMQSNGGVLSADRAAGLPVRTLMSGPAGGVVACRELASAVGVKRAVCADVGGTTFDVALVVDGQLVERTATSVDGRPVLGPTVDITSIGAGGGSVAWLDERGALKVGPRSAGAVPGPVCFGQGGTEPTVTDAQLLLGYLDPETFLGGRMRLDRDAAERALRSRVAEPLGLEVAEAAAGVLRIAETNMANAIRAVTVARGLDPREFTLVGYGGGGGLFAAAVAGELGIGHVVVPRAAATFSAWGILCSDYHEDASRTRIVPLDAVTVPTVVATLGELATEVVTHLRGYGFPADVVEVGHTADVRFRGQHHTVAVPVDPAWTADPGLLVAGVEAGFRSAHERLYGPRTHESVLEIVTLRARGTVVTDSPNLPAPAPTADGPTTGTRRVRFGATETDATVLDRDGLAVGTRVDGAAVVCEWANTTVVPPGWSATTDEHGHLHLTRDDPRTTGGHS